MNPLSFTFNLTYCNPFPALCGCAKVQKSFGSAKKVENLFKNIFPEGCFRALRRAAGSHDGYSAYSGYGSYGGYDGYGSYGSYGRVNRTGSVYGTGTSHP